MGLDGKAMKNRVTDRRPISARKSPVSQRVSTWLARGGVSPNAISIASVIFSVGACVCLFLSSSKFANPIWWGLAAVLIVLRLLANMFDGMVAVETGRTSIVGDLFNEVPDRISDVIIFISAGYAAGVLEYLGYSAATASLFVTYLRVLGNYMGVTKLFMGPMAKSHRMFTLAGVCLYNAIMPGFLKIPSLLTWGLAIIIAGSLITAVRRLQRIVGEVRA